MNDDQQEEFSAAELEVSRREAERALEAAAKKLFRGTNTTIEQEIKNPPRAINLRRAAFSLYATDILSQQTISTILLQVREGSTDRNRFNGASAKV